MTTSQQLDITSTTCTAEAVDVHVPYLPGLPSTGFCQPPRSSSFSGSQYATDNTAFGPLSDASSSPSSSMIFERSVQDLFTEELGDKIPLHYMNDDFIPSVLSASCEVLTNRSIDPETVEVFSLKRATSFRRTSLSGQLQFAPSVPTSPAYLLDNSDHQDYFVASHGENHSPSLSSLGPKFPASTIRPLASESKCLHRRSSISHFINKKKNGHVLSFCSFADLVSLEQPISHNTPNSGYRSSSSSLPYSPTMPIETTTSPTSPTLFTLSDSSPASCCASLGSKSQSYLLLHPAGDFHQVRSYTSNTSLAQSESDDLEDLDVLTLGETLRRNTEVMIDN